MELNLDFNPLQSRVADGDRYQTLQPVSPLNRWVQSFWQLTIPSGGFTYHSIPDNSVDWIVNINAFDDSFVVTPFMEPMTFEMEGPVSYFGIRFRVLGQQVFMSTPVGELSEKSNEKNESDVVGAQDVLPSHLLEQVFESLMNVESFQDRCHEVSRVLLSSIRHSAISPNIDSKMNSNVDSRLAKFIRHCYSHSVSNMNLSDKQCSEFGVSARQLRRLSQLYLGLSPREFIRVLRFQRTLESLKTGCQQSAWVDHYFDQPHFIREFKRLSGYTPTKFLNSSVLYNHHSSS